MPRLVKVRTVIKGAKAGTRLRVWASSLSGALVTAAPIAALPAVTRRERPPADEETTDMTPLDDGTNAVGADEAGIDQQPLEQEEREITVPTRRYEEGRLPFGVSRVDANGMESTLPPAVAYCQINSSPAGHARTTLSHAAGVFTLALTDYAEA